MINGNDQRAPKPTRIARLHSMGAFARLAAREIGIGLCVGLAAATAAVTVLTRVSLRNVAPGADLHALNLLSVVSRLEWVFAFVVCLGFLGIRVASGATRLFGPRYSQSELPAQAAPVASGQ